MTAKELNKAIRQMKDAQERIEGAKRNIEYWTGKANNPPSWANDGYVRSCKASVKDSQKDLAKYEAVYNNLSTNEEVIAELKAREELYKNFDAIIRQLVADWNKYEENQIQIRNKARQEMSKDEFVREYRGYYFAYTESFDEKAWTEENTKLAKAFVLDLANRCREYVGTVTSWDYLTMGSKSLEGFVIGTEGKAEVKSIWAGGWNIQRLHIRVLIHKAGN